MSEPLWQPRTDAQARLLGAAFFLGGGALLGYQLKTLADAVAERVESFTYLLAAFGLGEMGLVLGAYWLVRGLAGYQTVRALQKDPRRMRVVLIVTAVLTLGTFLALRHWLAAHGYET